MESGEDCDAGSVAWQPGSTCRGDCTVVECGDPDDSGQVTAVDSLLTLRAAVGASACDASLCNVDDTPGPPNASDALRLLRVAVGVPLALQCPAPPGR